MGKFKYSMQNILDIKIKLETQAKNEFSEANRAYLIEKEKLEELFKKRAVYEAALKEQLSGSLNISEINICKKNINSLKSAIRTQLMNVKKAEDMLEVKRVALNELMKERKTHEKLRDKKFEDFQKEEKDNESKEKLWEEYQKNPTPKLREQLIIEYAQLVRLVAGRLSMYLGHNVEYDDLVSYGIFGLIDAIDKFNLEKNVKFETYASLRIRGAILDQIRKMDWIPRTVRQRQRKIDEAIKNIELRTGKTANDADLAKELSISEDELCSWQSQLKVTNVVSLDEFDESGPEPVMDAAHNSHYAQPEEIVTQEELKTMLVKSLDNLTEKERRVIELYYYEDLTLKEISNILEVSESRVSQLHTKGLIKMRKVMGPYMNILTNA